MCRAERVSQLSLAAGLAGCLGILCSPEEGSTLVWHSLLLQLVWAKSKKNGSIMGSLDLGIENSEFLQTPSGLRETDSHYGVM